MRAIASRRRAGRPPMDRPAVDSGTPELLARRAPLTVSAVLAWHERLSMAEGGAEPPTAELVAAIVVQAAP